MKITTINPATEKKIKSYTVESKDKALKKLQLAHKAFDEWRHVSIEERLRAVENFAAVMQNHRKQMAQQITLEMGKPIKQALSEVDKCIASTHTLAKNFVGWKQVHEYKLDTGFSVHYQPLGVILGIMPWNFPLWQVVRATVPALLCGNAMLLKHAPNTWGCAELIEEMFEKTFPKNLYLNLQIDVKSIEVLVSDPRVRGASLTGSTRAGMSLAALCGKYLKKCVLELGGSDAYVILADADLDHAIDVCAAARLQNAGQSCVAAKRFIVVDEIYQKFVEGFREQLSQVRWGDPMAETTLLGPLARKDLRQILHNQVQKSVRQGAKLALNGKLPKNHKGYFYAPTLLTNVLPKHVAFQEELFGPVAAVVRAKDEKTAIQLANQSRYGLGGAIFSQDLERAKKLAVEEMDSGMAFVNDFVRSDASVPFGGTKNSGMGRELGREGAFEFVNIKTVSVKST